MGFANAAMLLGLSALALPVMAHLLGPSSRLRRTFAAVHLMVPVLPAGKGRHRLHDAALLALRCALLAAYVVAAAGPQRLRKASQSTEADATSVAALQLLLVDLTPSMAYVQQGRPLWQQARDDALATLDSLPAGTRVGLRLAGLAKGDGGACAVPPTADAGAVRAVLHAIKGPGGQVVLAQEAAALLAQAAAATAPAAAPENKTAGPAAPAPQAEATAAQLTVFSNFARNSWWLADRAPSLALPKLAQLSIRLVDAARRGPADPDTPGLLQSDAPLPTLENVAVQAATVAQMGGGEALLQVRLRNFGATERRRRTLVARLDGKAVQRAEVVLEAGAACDKQLRLPALPRGRHLLEVALEGAGADAAADGYAADDVFGRYVDVDRPLQVLLVQAGAVGATDADPSFFLTRALHQPVAQEQAFAPDAVSVAEMGRRLAEARATENAIDVVVLLDVGQLPKEAAAALRQHVAGGGGTLVALGEQTAADLEGFAHDAWLAAPLRDVAAADGGGALRLAPVNWQHPAFVGLDAGLWASLATTSVQRFVHVDARSLAAGATALRLEAGAPLLVVAPAKANAGRLALWTSSLDVQWTDFPLQGAYVPLLQHLLQWTAGRNASGWPGAVAAGAASVVQLPAGSTRLRLRPREAKSSAPMVVGTATILDGIGQGDPALPSLRWQAPMQPGHYRADVEQHGRWTALEGGEVVVNAAPAASDFAPLAPTELRALLRPASGGATLAGDVATLPGGKTDYAEALLWLCLALVLLETWASAPPSPKKASQVGVVPRVLSKFLRLRPALRVLRRTRVM